MSSTAERPVTPLHPVIQSILAKMLAAGQPVLSAGTPDDARKLLAAGRLGLGVAPALRERRRVTIQTRSGTIPGLLLLPEQTPVGLCVYLHGGGWVLGTLEDFSILGATLAHRSACAVVLPDYRLAPEYPFPAGLEDAQDAIAWAWKSRAELARADVPMVAAGDSAGGNLATVAARRLAGTVPLAGQVLIYPVVAADFSTPSYRRFAEGLPLLGADMEWFFRHYAPSDVWEDPDISPLGAASLAGVPKTVIALAEHDVLYDEGEAYAHTLEQHGRLLTLRRYDGVPHGFIRLHNLVDTADRAVSELSADIRRMCEEHGCAVAALETPM